jgi:hypothetical protein
MRAWPVMKRLFTANVGTPWSATDDDDLRMEIARGASAEEASFFLCRTADEVAIRAAVLGLQWHEFFH